MCRTIASFALFMGVSPRWRHSIFPNTLPVCLEPLVAAKAERLESERKEKERVQAHLQSSWATRSI